MIIQKSRAERPCFFRESNKKALTFCGRSIILNADAESEVIQKMSPRTGRPPSNNPKSASLHIRLTPEEKEKIISFAHKSGYTILDLIRLGINAAKQK